MYACACVSVCACVCAWTCVSVWNMNESRDTYKGGISYNECVNAPVDPRNPYTIIFIHMWQKSVFICIFYKIDFCHM